MNSFKFHKIFLVAAIFGGFTPLYATAASKLRVNCDPAHDTRGEPKPGWSKPWAFTADQVSDQNSLEFTKTFNDGWEARFRFANRGGKVELVGEVYSPKKKVDGTAEVTNKFSSVRFDANAPMPIASESVYVWTSGKRNCSIVLTNPQAQTLSAALGGGNAQRDPQTARNTSDIAVNRGAIAQNSDRIDANSGRIDRNEKGIASNRQAIVDSNARIADNRSAIGRNADAINSTNDRITGNRAEMKARTTTINEGYGNKATGTGEDWAMYKSGVPFQQNQFCRLIGNFKEQFDKARAEKNQIKENIALREREQRLVALLPKGAFQSWIVRAVSVKQASDGSAAVLFELPCDVVVGSYACGTTASQFLGTIAENSPMYNELAKVSVGDFLGVSGQFYFGADSKAFEKNRSVASFRQMPAGSHCQGAAAGIQDGEFFAVTTVNISTLK